MSNIVAFRDRVIQAIQTLYPEMDVEWYDGLFDEHDVADWTLKTPCARVAVMNVPEAPHTSTGRLNACLRCVVVIIDENSRAQRDGDAKAWEYVENIANLANLNQFGDPNAAPATRVKFKRISQPVLRREGVSIGVVEWETGLMIGRNRALEHDQVFFNGAPVPKMPTTFTADGYVHSAAYEGHEQLDVTPEVD
jgi:hypothetical protein